MSTPKQVKHWYGTRRAYDALDKDEGTLYFISDEAVIYRGSQLYGYTGPFAVHTLQKNGNDLTVAIESGAVVVGKQRFPVNEVTSLFAQTLSSGYDLYLVGSYNSGTSSATFNYSTFGNGSTIPSNDNTFYTRIAGNRGGVMRQFQFGEIVTVPWGISGGGGSGGMTDEDVSSAIDSALGAFATRYGLTPIPVVKYAAPNIVPSRSNTITSNTNVTLSAVNWDAAVTSKQYSSNGTTWLTYTNGGVVVSANNQTRYFRGVDASGDLTSVASYTVTNIDKTGPTINLTGGYDSNAYTSQTVSATTTEAGVLLYWTTNNWTTVSSSTSPAVVTMTTSGTLTFSASDIYGNKTTKSVTFPNIGGTPGGGWDDDDQPEI